MMTLLGKKQTKFSWKTALLTPKFNFRNTSFAFLLGFIVAVILVFAIYQDKGGDLIGDLFKGNFLTSQTTALWFDKVVVLGLGGISVAIGIKTGLLNIGISGQMLGGALITFLVLDKLNTSSIPERAVLALFMMVISAAAISAICGALKAFFRVNEVVSAIMLNWVIVYLSVFLKDNKKDSIALGGGTTPALVLGYDTHHAQIFNANGVDNAWLLAGMGILLFFVAAIGAYLLVYKTTLGFKLRATGLNETAAKYSGYKSKQLIMTSFIISGVLSGMAGYVFYFLAGNSIETPKYPSQEGFQTIVVSLVALNNPLAIIPSAMLFTLLTGPVGGVSLGGLPADAILIFTGTITYFVSIATLFIYYHPIERMRMYFGKSKRNYQNSVRETK